MTAGAALMRRRSPSDDHGVIWAILVGAGLLVGLIVGRLWALAAVVPFAIWVGSTNELEGDLGTVVTVVGSCLLATGILAGVFARRRMRRPTGSG
jgi:hypothetical protein